MVASLERGAYVFLHFIAPSTCESPSRLPRDECVSGPRVKALWKRQGDALELVMLLRIVDRDAFMEMAQKFCPVAGDPEIVWGDFHPDEQLPSSIDVKMVNRTNDETWAHWVLSTLFEPVALSDRPKKFLLARGRILGMVRDDDAVTRRVCDTFTIPVRIMPWFSSAQLTNALLSAIATMKEAMDRVLTKSDDVAEENERSARRVYPYRVANAEIDFRNLGHPLRSLLFVQICSVVATTTGVTGFDISNVLDSYHADERRHAWLWMIHCVFSSSSSHCIHTSTLRTSKLTDEDVACTRAYLQARNPFRLLCHPSWRVGIYNEDSDRDTRRKRVALEKGCLLCLSPARTRSRETMKLAAPGWFDVIQEGINFVDVVIPGYGQCHHKEITEWVTVPNEPVKTSFDTHRVTSLTIALRSSKKREQPRDESVNIAAFLALVGQPIESLQVWCPTANAEPLLDAVWQHCPQVKCVQLAGAGLHSFRYLIDAFESDKCRITSLRLANVTLEDEGPIVDFIDALADPITKIASTLQELDIVEDANHIFISNEQLPRFHDCSAQTQC